MRIRESDYLSQSVKEFAKWVFASVMAALVNEKLLLLRTFS